MSIDRETLFSDNRPLTAGDSTDIVKVPIKDVGRGHPLYLFAILSGTEAATGDLIITVNTADNADMSGTVKLAEYTIKNPQVKKGGSVLVAALPTGCKEFLRTAYAGVTTGTITCGLGLAGQTNV